MKLKVQAKLDPQFEPLSVVCREMREATAKDGQDIIIAVERNKGYIRINSWYWLVCSTTRCL